VARAISLRKTPAVNSNADIESQLRAIEREGGDGVVEFGRGAALRVSNLGKQFFGNGVTKGAVMRYYARIWNAIKRHVKDRPLVLKRYPDGVGGPMFYQQSAGTSVPDIVRVETFDTREDGPKPRIIGGDLATLLYTVQLGSIEVHTWLSRVGDADSADHCLIDLDPGDDVAFSSVVALARDALQVIRQCELTAAVKTSGSSGMHLVIPLPPKTTYETSARLGTLIARVVAAHCPQQATFERSLRARPAGTIYVDALQNARGKSMACAYSVRAKEGATVSAPLRERELTARLRTEAFSVKTMPARVARAGDLWADALAAKTTKQRLTNAMKMLERTMSAVSSADEPLRPESLSRRR
jgi:bifunctional non-homologous end joining protein LigD